MPADKLAGEVRQAETWEEALAAMDDHLDEIEAGLVWSGAMPGYRVVGPRTRLPAELADRARRVHARQRDMMDALAERMAVVGRFLREDAIAVPRPVPVYLDRRS